MQYYSQHDSHYRNITIGNTPYKIGSYGCLIVSLAMLDSRPPNVVNALLTAHECFTAEGYLISECAAKALSMDYRGKTGYWQTGVCIAETDFFKSKGYPQHFFVWLGNGEIIDPIDGEQKVNPYPIVSFRLFVEKTNQEDEVNQGELNKKRHEWNVELARHARQALLGHVVAEDAEADAKVLDQKFDEGDPYEAGRLIERYVASDEYKAKIACPPNITCDPALKIYDTSGITPVAPKEDAQPTLTVEKDGGWLIRLIEAIQKWLKRKN